MYTDIYLTVCSPSVKENGSELELGFGSFFGTHFKLNNLPLLQFCGYFGLSSLTNIEEQGLKLPNGVNGEKPFLKE